MDDVPTMVQQVRFTPVRMREGYQMSEVDDFLDGVVAAWWACQPLGPMVDGARFTPVRLREGYEMGEVDAFLDRLRTAPPAPASPGVSTGEDRVPTGSTRSTGEGASTGPTVAGSTTGTPSVVQEQRGLLSRIFGKE